MFSNINTKVFKISVPFGRNTLVKAKHNSHHNVFSRQFSVLKEYTSETEGEGFGRRTYLFKNGEKISPWHDVQLYKSGSKDTFLGCFELSYLNIAKMEVASDEAFNPFKQDTNKSRHTGEKQLRYYAKFPLFNYGMLPQTWENSTVKDKVTECLGDNDPLDIWELGADPLPTGSVVELKILGAIWLIDQDELDWKILTLNTTDADRLSIRDHKDYDEVFPNRIQAIMEWFRDIKTHDGKPANKFGYNDQVLSQSDSLEIIEENHQHYQDLKSGKISNEFEFWMP